MLNLIGAYKDLLNKTKETMILQLTQFQPITASTDISELEKILHKPVRVNPNMVSPSFQPNMHEKVRQLSR